MTVCGLFVAMVIIATIIDLANPQPETDIVFGDKNGHRHHATPMPDGHHWISGIKICKASETGTEIVGIQVTTSNGEAYTVQEEEGLMHTPAICNESFLLPYDDCIQYFNMAFDESGAAVQLFYSTKLDHRVKAIGFSNGIQDLNNA